MTIDLTGKMIGGLVALASTATGITILHNHLKPRTVGEELQYQEGKQLLTENASEWEQLIKKYESSEHPEKISELSLGYDNEKKSNFYKKCSELWNTKLGNISTNTEKDKIKKDLKNWCVNNPGALTQ